MSAKGVMRPVTEARELGRTKPPFAGVWDARELGRLVEASGLVVVVGAAEKPNDSLLAERGGSAVKLEAVVLAEVRLRAERTVTVAGMDGRPDERGEDRGGVDEGAGSLERVVCTRSSSFCIRPMRPLIWLSEREEFAAGRSCVAMLRREVGTRGVAEGPAVRVEGVAVGIDGPREWRGGRRPDILGVVGGAIDLVLEIKGVIGATAFFDPPEVFDTGGDGGDV
jgi:hypothetical protein